MWLAGLLMLLGGGITALAIGTVWLVDRLRGGGHPAPAHARDAHLSHGRGRVTLPPGVVIPPVGEGPTTPTPLLTDEQLARYRAHQRYQGG